MKSIKKLSLYSLVITLFLGCGSLSTSKQERVVSITTTKNSYFVDENITINFKNMLGDKNDWIGIFEQNSTNTFKHALRRRDTNGSKNGKFIFEGIEKVGTYEARAFFKDSLVLEASNTFKVISKKSSSTATIYEDAEESISPKWRQISGSYPPLRVKNGFNSKGALVLTPEWVDNRTNNAEYQLDMNNTTQKILEMDMGGLKDYKLPNLHQKGFIQHYKVGVRVTTKDGKRGMIWDSFFNHGGVEPFKQGKWLSYPSPVEHVRGFDNVPSLPIDRWVHFRVDVQKELEKLEPENKILSIDTFFATGGFLDNIKLSD